MSVDSGWLVLALAAVFVAWLGATVWRAGLQRHPRRGRDDAAAASTAMTGADDAVAPVATAQGQSARSVRSARSAPALSSAPPAPALADDALAQSLLRAEAAQRAEPSPSAPARPAGAPAAAASPPLAPAAAAAAAAAAARTARPQTPRFERVLAVEAGSAAAWQSASPLPLQPAQAQALAALCAPAFEAARGERAGTGPVLALTFPAGSMMRVARADAPMLKALAADNDASTLRSLAWLDSHAASALAATLLAGLAAARHLDGLGSELHALGKDVAGLPASAAQASKEMAGVVDELRRLQREVRGNHAAAVARTAYRQQVEQAALGAAALWRDLNTRLGAARRELAEATGARRLGDVWVERLSAGLQSRAELFRCQRLATRALAAAWLLRTALGTTTTTAGMTVGVHPLQSASAGLRAGADLDRALAEGLLAALQPGRDDDHPDHDDASWRRLAADGIGALAAEAASGDGADRLAAAYAAAAEGFPDASGGDDRWLVRAHAGSASVEVRRAAPARLH